MARARNCGGYCTFHWTPPTGGKAGFWTRQNNGCMGVNCICVDPKTLPPPDAGDQGSAQFCSAPCVETGHGRKPKIKLRAKVLTRLGYFYVYDF
jgi:hypothetical protein